MSLEIKCAKLRFITQEMELAHAIATHAPTPFVARVVARHVLGRAQDFIAIARDVPSLLRAIGKDTRDLKARTKAYAEAFDEYYATTRTKIAAHVQDLEWVERLELWTDIEVVKLAYFVEGAREIYDAIGALSPPNFQGYAAPVESGDAAFGAMLNTVAASRPPDGLVRAGADPLAATRPDTVAVLNFSPVHQRAGQLAAINMWVHEQLGLWVAFRAFAGAERILRARILTDLVSFALVPMVIRLIGGSGSTISCERPTAVMPRRSTNCAGSIGSRRWSRSSAAFGITSGVTSTRTMRSMCPPSWPSLMPSNCENWRRFTPAWRASSTGAASARCSLRATA